MRLGILGGTFDPIHFGHLRAAEEMCEDLNLSKVLIMPGSQPPHKDGKRITTFHHRLEMARIGSQISEYLEVIDIEGKREGPSYSIETLREIRDYYNSKLGLYFILGSDAFKEIKTWKEYGRLFEISHFVVLKRPGISLTQMAKFVESLNAGFKKGKNKNTFTNSIGNHIIFKSPTLMDISSTKIRKAIGEGNSIRYLLPEKVRQYILEKGLYNTDEFS